MAHSFSNLVDQFLIESFLSTIVVGITDIMGITPKYSPFSKFSSVTLVSKVNLKLFFLFLIYPSLTCDHKRTHPPIKGFSPRTPTTISCVVATIGFCNTYVSACLANKIKNEHCYHENPFKWKHPHTMKDALQ